MDFRRVAMLQIDFEKAFDKVSHSILFKILEYVGFGKVILDGVKMAYRDCTTKILVNRQLAQSIDVCASVRQGCALSSLLFVLYLEPLCAKINSSSNIQGFALESCEVKVMAYADDVAFFCVNKVFLMPCASHRSTVMLPAVQLISRSASASGMVSGHKHQAVSSV